ncbi:MAG: 50S ribosomal protein L6 [Candidatus Micrarchaeia archaeon]|jgi:large subunit ribosomal protein L6
MQQIQFQNGVEANVEGDELVIKGKLGIAKAKINQKLLSVKVDGNKIIVEPSQEKRLRRVAAIAENAFVGRVNALLDGVQNGIEKKLQVAFVHFPIALELKGNILFIKNLFGERAPRKAKIAGNTKLEIKGNEITVKGVDPYEVGQTITNIEKACKITNKDTRIFQDGIYEVEGE